jgi:hypothetical protein
MAAVGLALAWFGVEPVRRNAGLDATTPPLSMAWLYVPISFTAGSACDRA